MRYIFLEDPGNISPPYTYVLSSISLKTHCNLEVYLFYPTKYNKKY